MALDRARKHAKDCAMRARKHTAALVQWDRLRVLLALRRGGTLSAAGRALGLDHSTVARQLEAIERELGAPLFERGPDGFTVTPLGEEVLGAAERMDEEVASLLRRLDAAPDELTGLVRLTTTPYLASALFAPALGAFMQKHPGLQLELMGDNRSYQETCVIRAVSSVCAMRSLIARKAAPSRHWLYLMNSTPPESSVNQYFSPGR